MISKKDISALIAIVKIHYSFNYKNFSDADFGLLAKSWYEDLKNYPRELVGAAFNRAKLVNKISITTADIVEQIEKIQSAFEPSPQELWRELREIIQKATRLVYTVRYAVKDESGEWREYSTQDALKRLYENMRPEFKRFVGNINGLIDLAKMDEYEYVEARFLKSIDTLKKQVDIQANPTIAALVTGTVKKLEGGQ